MTKTTQTTKKSTAVAEDQNQATPQEQANARPTSTLDPEQARKDIAEMFAKAAKAARPKAD